MATTVTPGASIAPKPAEQKLQPSTIQASPGENDTGVKNYSPPVQSFNQPIIPKTTPTLPEGVPQGYKPIRQTLNERNIADERIGFDNEGYVTIDNVQGVKPQYNIDGVTYADEATINQLTQNAYERNGTPLVATRNYATSKGYGGIVGWDGTNPTIGGVAVPATYITEDGVSYIPQSEADRLIADFKETAEIDGNRKVVEDTDQKYTSREEEAVAKILGRDEFSYNPENDVVFQSYADQYRRNAEDALRRILNDNNTSVAGASGAVLSEAVAAYDNEMDKIADVIPELAKDAYNRYVDEDSLRRDDLDIIQELANTYYNRHYTANRDQITDSSKDLSAERNEDQRQFENSLSLSDEARKQETHGMQKEEHDVYTEGQKLSNEGQKLSNEGQKLSNEGQKLSNEGQKTANEEALFNMVISRAVQRGYFTKDDEAVIPELEKYRNPNATTPKNAYTISPFDAEAEYTKRMTDTELNARGAALRTFGKDVF